VLGITKEVFQVVPGGPAEMIQKGSGDVILLSNLGRYLSQRGRPR
jgi:hypothetical protein